MLQQFTVAGDEHGNQIRSEKDQAIYAGMLNPTDRVDDAKKEENDKKGQSTAGLKKNKFVRTVEDGLLLVVLARINEHCVHALINSGATTCFVTPACITAVGLKGTQGHFSRVRKWPEISITGICS